MNTEDFWITHHMCKKQKNFGWLLAISSVWHPPTILVNLVCVKHKMSVFLNYDHKMSCHYRDFLRHHHQGTLRGIFAPVSKTRSSQLIKCALFPRQFIDEFCWWHSDDERLMLTICLPNTWRETAICSIIHVVDVGLRPMEQLPVSNLFVHGNFLK